MSCRRSSRLFIAIFAIVIPISFSCGTRARAATEKVVHRFSPFPHGQNPGTLVKDSAGNLYGVASGGLYNDGVVYRLVADSSGNLTETVLHNFTGGPDGGEPSGVVPDNLGNIYGFTTIGGTHNLGIFFELTPSAHETWKETVLYNFADTRYEPLSSGPVMDRAGNFYGQTYNWGPTYGFVFQLTKSAAGVWSENVLHTFTGGADGGAPFGPFVFDQAGNLYGVAAMGGSSQGGVVFELSPSTQGNWTETVLYNFLGGADGSFPESGLVADQNGNLFGSTLRGGDESGCTPTGGCGTIFQLQPGSGGQWTEKLLYSFGNAPPNPIDVGPSLPALDAAGNLFGTTSQGGAGRYCEDGCGTVFELSPDGSGHWNASILHSFTGTPPTGYNPGSVIVGPDGRLYGTTVLGGRDQGFNGTVFELTLGSGGQWTTKTVYGFPTSDGNSAGSNLLSDSAGNFYGTTSSGGTYNAGTVFKIGQTSGGQWIERVLYSFSGEDYPSGNLVFDPASNLYGTSESGLVFELSPTIGDGYWTEKSLYSFATPATGLVFDTAGNLYGTTIVGGDFNWGSVFQLSPGPNGSWSATTIYSFKGPPADAASPHAGVIFDAAGNLYGTTAQGGSSTNCLVRGLPEGCGTVFRLSPGAGGVWNETVLYSFASAGGDGGLPLASVVFDNAGNLYGTTRQGGMAGNCSWGRLHTTCGTVFELSPSGQDRWTETVLYAFRGSTEQDGANPLGSLTIDASGNLYGTTSSGGIPTAWYKSGLGTVFELSPSSGGWEKRTLVNFGNLHDANPRAGLLLDSAGNLYGTNAGNTAAQSVIFEITP